MANKIIKLIFLSIFNISLLTSIVCAEKQSEKPDNTQKIRIGVSIPLSGEGAIYGYDIRDSILFANETLANNSYELVFEDDQCSAKEGVTVANKFVREKIPIVIGFACSSPILSSKTIYENNNTLLMIFYASSPRISSIKNKFRTYLSDDNSANVLADYVNKQGHSSIGILSGESDYAQDLKDAFIKRLDKNKTSIVEINYLPDTHDFKPNLLKLKNKKVDAIFLNSHLHTSFQIQLNQLSLIKFTTTIYGAYWPAFPSIIESSSNLMEGVVFIDSPSLDNVLNNEGKSLYSSFKNSGYQIRTSELIFLSTFEGFRALHLALESGVNPAEFLKNEKFSGIFGNWEFDSQGEIQGLSPALKIIRSGNIKIIEQDEDSKHTLISAK
ncbi:MAG TPA: penicillin-binding protein activator [Oligoflexia bacterium]|nr:penicillin-binding protein activator [Oligoflexia bacterium]HMP49053.1 penicillin-binding protein activator [Oligoflexia bacterium]